MLLKSGKNLDVIPFLHTSLTLAHMHCDGDYNIGDGEIKRDEKKNVQSLFNLLHSRLYLV